MPDQQILTPNPEQTVSGVDPGLCRQLLGCAREWLSTFGSCRLTYADPSSISQSFNARTGVQLAAGAVPHQQRPRRSPLLMPGPISYPDDYNL